jgi:SulP family sulfate permease
MLHAGFLLVFLLFASHLASFVPVCALAGLLMVVAWNMVERPAFAALLKDWRSALVLLTTFGLTVVHDLMTGILAGCGVAAVMWLFSRGPRRLGH